MTTILSQGTTLAIGDGASPEVFNNIGEVRSIDGPDGEAPTIIVSNLSSTAVEKRLGLADEGSVTISLAFDPDDTQQALLRTSRTAKTQKNFRITCTDSPATVISFAGFIKTFARSWAVDEVALLNVTIDITGSVTDA